MPSLTLSACDFAENVRGSHSDYSETEDRKCGHVDLFTLGPSSELNVFVRIAFDVWTSNDGHSTSKHVCPQLVRLCKFSKLT